MMEKIERAMQNKEFVDLVKSLMETNSDLFSNVEKTATLATLAERYIK